MTTTKNNQTSNKQNSGNQGFASMPKEKVQEIASKGGKASHGTQASTTSASTTSKNATTSHTRSTQEENKGHGNQGFASMPKEKVQEIASKGGKASHGGHKDEGNTQGNRNTKR